MSAIESLGEFEQVVLLAILRLGEGLRGDDRREIPRPHRADRVAGLDLHHARPARDERLSGAPGSAIPHPNAAAAPNGITRCGRERSRRCGQPPRAGVALEGLEGGARMNWTLVLRLLPADLRGPGGRRHRGRNGPPAPGVTAGFSRDRLAWATALRSPSHSAGSGSCTAAACRLSVKAIARPPAGGIRCDATSGSASACFAASRRSRWSSRGGAGRSASAPTPRFSAWWTPFSGDPSPRADADRIMSLRRTARRARAAMYGASPADFFDWRRDATSFAAMAAFNRRRDEPDRNRGASNASGRWRRVTLGFLERSACRRRCGRNFRLEEEMMARPRRSCSPTPSGAGLRRCSRHRGPHGDLQRQPVRGHWCSLQKILVALSASTLVPLALDDHDRGFAPRTFSGSSGAFGPACRSRRRARN